MLCDLINHSKLLELAQGFEPVTPDSSSWCELGGVWAQDNVPATSIRFMAIVVLYAQRLKKGGIHIEWGLVQRAQHTVASVHIGYHTVFYGGLGVCSPEKFKI